MFPCLARGNLRTSWVCAPVSRHSITCHRLSLPVPVPVALWPRRQQAALVYEDTCSNCSMLDLLNARFAQCSKPPKKCSKSPVPCKNSKFNNSKFKIQNSKITLSPSPPRQCFCRTVRYVRASAYTWRQQTCPPLLCSRPVSGSRGSQPSRCRRSL